MSLTNTLGHGHFNGKGEREISHTNVPLIHPTYSPWLPIGLLLIHLK